uniref:DUF502 domain-containing protein n=1 Tax=Caenorhabditis tropicalis TaxID=1561998 RepID=A0A1I7UYI0_9PELO
MDITPNPICFEWYEQKKALEREERRKGREEALRELALTATIISGIILILLISYVVKNIISFVISKIRSKRVGEVTQTPIIPFRSEGFKDYISLPSDSQIISIRFNGFGFGEEGHDFIPLKRTTSGSYFTYQMFGDNRIQVTYYVEEGVSYAAGFCIYVKNPMIGVPIVANEENEEESILSSISEDESPYWGKRLERLVNNGVLPRDMETIV